MIMEHGESQTRSARRVQIGDAAVDGLIDGVLAGLALALYLVLADWMNGGVPLAVLTGFDLNQWSSPLRGLALHLTLAAIYGAIFSIVRGVIVQRWPLGRWASGAIGLGYGLLLWWIAPWVLPAGVAALLRAVTGIDFLIAHVIYGISLGTLSSRR
jgi:hypothetical protein